MCSEVNLLVVLDEYCKIFCAIHAVLTVITFLITCTVSLHIIHKCMCIMQLTWSCAELCYCSVCKWLFAVDWHAANKHWQVAGR